jgi:hypothetical protein
MLPLIDRFRNAIDFPLRQWLHWRRPGLKIRNEEKFGLYAALTEKERLSCEREAGRMLEQYHLQSFFENSSRSNYCENLFYLEVLEKTLGELGTKLAEELLIADIGPSSWFYIQAYQAFFRWWEAPAGRQVSIEGYEVDPYRVYQNFYSRYDHARAYMAGLENVEYYPVGFEQQAARYDVITMLFPFVFVKDHREWGLPDGIFQPQTLLEDAWNSLKQGGILLVVNQGENEHQKELVMFEEAGIKPAVSTCHDSLLFRYEISRFVLAGIKNG